MQTSRDTSYLLISVIVSMAAWGVWTGAMWLIAGDKPSLWACVVFLTFGLIAWIVETIRLRRTE